MASKSKVLKVLGVLLLLTLAAGGALVAYGLHNWPHHGTPGTIEKISPSGDATLDGIRKGIAFLRAHQEPDGNFVLGGFAPRAAWTALAASAMMRSPDHYNVKDHPFLRKAIDAVLAETKPGGGIYSKIPFMSFSNYSTAVVVVALKDAGDKAYEPVIAKAAEYLKQCQHRGDDDNGGGMSYDPGKRPDLNNTVCALEALNAAGIPKDDPVYQEALKFVTKCQNNPETNTRPDAGSDGGLIYAPGRSPAGERTEEGGKKYQASYGAMTYAGLISFLYADVDKSDPRVKSAWKWIQSNYDLDLNVNMKAVGLFYYYRIMAKALQRYGERYVVDDSGVKHDWAEELSRHLLSLQRPDGSWANSSASDYFEDDPVLVTSYVVATLSICHEEMQKHAAVKSAE